jgi:hypothetical protein
MPGMQVVIFHETFIAVTILAPRPKASRNVREPCCIEQSDEKSVQPIALMCRSEPPKASKARLGHALFKQGN